MGIRMTRRSAIAGASGAVLAAPIGAEARPLPRAQRRFFIERNNLPGDPLVNYDVPGGINATALYPNGPPLATIWYILGIGLHVYDASDNDFLQFQWVLSRNPAFPPVPAGTGDSTSFPLNPVAGGTSMPISRRVQADPTPFSTRATDYARFDPPIFWRPEDRMRLTISAIYSASIGKRLNVSMEILEIRDESGTL